MGRQGLTGKTAGREAFQGRAGKAGAHTQAGGRAGRAGQQSSRAAVNSRQYLRPLGLALRGSKKEPFSSLHAARRSSQSCQRLASVTHHSQSSLLVLLRVVRRRPEPGPLNRRWTPALIASPTICIRPSPTHSRRLLTLLLALSAQAWAKTRELRRALWPPPPGFRGPSSPGRGPVTSVGVNSCGNQPKLG